MKKILRNVITGGPCGGKTTALKELEALYESIGYKVIVVNEAATELMNGGIKPGENGLSGFDFQVMVMGTQIGKEKNADYAANHITNERVAILYDRATQDNRGYLSEEEYQLLLEYYGLKEEDILEGYDLVIHMTTAAKGKEEYYSNDTNVVRFETPEQARKQDDDTLEAWNKHPNRLIFENDCLFPEKMARVKKGILQYVKQFELQSEEQYEKVNSARKKIYLS